MAAHETYNLGGDPDTFGPSFGPTRRTAQPGAVALEAALSRVQATRTNVATAAHVPSSSGTWQHLAAAAATVHSGVADSRFAADGPATTFSSYSDSAGETRPQSTAAFFHAQDDRLLSSQGSRSRASRPAVMSQAQIAADAFVPSTRPAYSRQNAREYEHDSDADSEHDVEGGHGYADGDERDAYYSSASVAADGGAAAALGSSSAAYSRQPLQSSKGPSPHKSYASVSAAASPFNASGSSTAYGASTLAGISPSGKGRPPRALSGSTSITGGKSGKLGLGRASSTVDWADRWEGWMPAFLFILGVVCRFYRIDKPNGVVFGEYKWRCSGADELLRLLSSLFLT